MRANIDPRLMDSIRLFSQPTSDYNVSIYTFYLSNAQSKLVKVVIATVYLDRRKDLAKLQTVYNLTFLKKFVKIDTDLNFGIVGSGIKLTTPLFKKLI